MAAADPPSTWFERHTFSASVLSMEDLARLKHERSLTVSVCLPALNEAETVGAICSLLRESLVERANVVDEIVVVDSGSGDDTVRIAEAAGATVYRAGDLVPEVGTRVWGKGDVLWRSLSVLSGDIVVWLDSDTINPHAGFVTDLVAPLLENESLILTKAFYDRPLQAEDGFLTSGGARVTELAARPLLQLFYPELAGVVQPLSGEYAGYRETFLDLSFFTGYGVDIGLLIDLAERFSTDRLAQVDLGRRVHRNRETVELGRTSFEVIQAMLKRFDDLGRIKLGAELPTELVQFVPGVGGPERKTHQLPVPERPPMREVLKKS